MSVPVGVTYSVRAGSGPVSWLLMCAPAPFEDTRRTDTFFTGEQLEAAASPATDVRDPRNQLAFRFDPASMDLDNLAKALLDSAIGAAFHDDSQVARLLVERRRADREGIWMKLSPMLG